MHTAPAPDFDQQQCDIKCDGAPLSYRPLHQVQPTKRQLIADELLMGLS